MQKIISYIVLALIVLGIGYARAGTGFDFAAATDGTYICPTYCMGFTTSDPAHTVDSVNVQVSGSAFAITLSIDGVVYRGTSTGTGQSFTAPGLLANVSWTTATTCTHSGRGQTCVTRRHAVSGSLAL